MQLPLACVLLLSAAALCLSETPVEKFKRQHVNNGMDSNRCEAVMRDRRITEANNRCKDKNTFIAKSLNEVQKVCRDEGVPYGGDQKISRKKFKVVNCKLQSGARYPKCKYKGSSDNRKIIIGCDQNDAPVHFGGLGF